MEGVSLNSNSSPPAAPNTSSNSSTENTTTTPSNTPQTEINITSELNSIFSVLKLSLPFIALLLLRFLCTYLIKIIFLIFLYFFQSYFLHELNHQISLKTSHNRQRIYLLFCLSFIFSFLFLQLSSTIFDENLWKRYLLFSYHNPQIDFISVVWLCCVTDLTVSSFATTLKLGITLFLAPNTMESRSHSSSASLLPLSSNISPALIFQSVLRSIPLTSRSSTHRTRSNSSDIDIESGSGRSQTDESTQEHSTDGTEVIRSFLMSYGTPRRRSSSSPTPSPSTHGEHVTSRSQDDQSPTRNTEAHSYLRMKRIYSNIDLVFAIYRSILPMPVWGCYFSNGPGADMIPVSYFCIKVINISYLVRAIVEAIGNTIAGRTEYGRYSTPAEIQRMDSEMCTICFDNFHHPVTLPCRHVFCEHCVFEWLDKENTCPICRAEVREESSSAAYLKDMNLSSPIIM